MQFNNKEYNKEKHDRWKALTVKQPYATALVTPSKTIDGVTYGLKSIEVRSRKTLYRGDLIICASQGQDLPNFPSGCCLGLVELYDVKPIEDFTPEDWENTCIPEDERSFITLGYGWLMRNPRRLIEMPVKGQLGIFNLVYTKGVIMEYPQHVVVTREDYKKIMSEYHAIWKNKK